ncbi:MAG: CBS domain-containing protein [Planctomycetota bacterium]
MKVSKYMTSKLITAKPDMSVKDAFLTMRKQRVRHLPVVEGDRLVGIISDRDLRRPKWADALDDWTSYYQIDDNITVADVMTKNPETVCTRDSILKAVHIFREQRYGALPVVNRKDELVGILSAQDLLAALEELLVDHKEREETEEEDHEEE